AERVVVTVPLKLLQDGDMDFSPPLPTSTLPALHRLGIPGGMKVSGRYPRRVSPDGFSRARRRDCCYAQVWTGGRHNETATGTLVSSCPSTIVFLRFRCSIALQGTSWWGS